MQHHPPTLDYATPPRRRPFLPAVTPPRLAAIGSILSLISLSLPWNLANETFAPNPLRLLAGLLAVACAIAFALLRLWNDPRSPRPRKTMLSACLLASVTFFASAHLSIWNSVCLPPFGLDSLYWRLLLLSAAPILAAVLVCAVHPRRINDE